MLLPIYPTPQATESLIKYIEFCIEKKGGNISNIETQFEPKSKDSINKKATRQNTVEVKDKELVNSDASITYGEANYG